MVIKIIAAAIPTIVGKETPASSRVSVCVGVTVTVVTVVGVGVEVNVGVGVEVAVCACKFAENTATNTKSSDANNKTFLIFSMSFILSNIVRVSQAFFGKARAQA